MLGVSTLTLVCCRENPEITTKSLAGFNLKPTFPDSAHPEEILKPVTQLNKLLLNDQQSLAGCPHHTLNITTDSTGTRKNTDGDHNPPLGFKSV